jgi:hypothetical protein
MTFDELFDEVDVMDLERLVGNVLSNLQDAGSCETISDLKANIENAYEDAVELLAELKQALKVISGAKQL